MRRIFLCGLLAGIIFSCNKSEQEYVSESRELLQTGSYEKSIEVLNRAIEDYNSPELYNLRGVSHFELGDIDKAIEDFNMAIKSDTSDYKPYYNRGKAYFEKGEFFNALNDFSVAMDLNPSVADIYINHGNALYELKEYSNALESYDFAVKLEPGAYLAHLNKGRALILLKDFSEAAGSLEKAIEINSERGDAFYYLAYSKYLSGSEEEVCLLYSKSKALGFEPGEDALEKVCGK